VCIRYRGNVSIKPLPSNDRGIFTEQLSSNDRGDTQTYTHTATWSHKPTLFFQNNVSRLRIQFLFYRARLRVVRPEKSLLYSRHGQEGFLFSTASRPALGPTQPPIQWVPGTLSPGGKWPGHEADHSPPSFAEVKNGGAIPPLPHMSSWQSA
jgi:hypothetical protein